MRTLYPIFNRTESRAAKEARLAQRGCVVWMTGLSGSGKSTIAIALEQRLSAMGYLCCVVDGDNIRHTINADLGFSAADRAENIRRTAQLCHLLASTGIVTIASLLCPTNAMRHTAEQIIGSDDLIVVHISTPIEECERRDVKGLYARARAGLIMDFTGISAPFEVPERADITIDTTECTVEQSVDYIVYKIKNRIEYGVQP